ncbi:MAG: metalloregulator ArsR/SmtB family transcription factor [Actinomycetota bacterium]
MASGDHTHPFDPAAVEQARAAQLTTEEAERLSAIFALVGDPVRARVIYAFLAVDELCVGDVALAANVNDDAASYALRVLRTAGLVQRRREGRLSFYRLTDHGTRPALRTALDAFLRLSTHSHDGDG